MTRINVLPVDELTDNFLMAEYFELPRIFLMAEKHSRAGRLPKDLDIPGAYTFGKGHMTFFYDKLAWLYARWVQLYEEGTKRNLTLQQDPVTLSVNPLWFQSTAWWRGYEPTPEAIQLNRDRLQYRRRYDGGMYETQHR